MTRLIRWIALVIAIVLAGGSKLQAAEEAMRHHLRRIFSVIGVVQERYPEYFSASTQPEPSRTQRFEGEIQLGDPVSP